MQIVNIGLSFIFKSSYYLIFYAGKYCCADKCPIQWHTSASISYINHKYSLNCEVFLCNKKGLKPVKTGLGKTCVLCFAIWETNEKNLFGKDNSNKCLK